jgi:hypothetical protein
LFVSCLVVFLSHSFLFLFSLSVFADYDGAFPTGYATFQTQYKREHGAGALVRRLTSHDRFVREKSLGYPRNRTLHAYNSDVSNNNNNNGGGGGDVDYDLNETPSAAWLPQRRPASASAAGRRPVSAAAAGARRMRAAQSSAHAAAGDAAGFVDRRHYAKFARDVVRTGNVMPCDAIPCCAWSAYSTFYVTLLRATHAIL